jgi:hypothetical protein
VVELICGGYGGGSWVCGVNGDWGHGLKVYRGVVFCEYGYRVFGVVTLFYGSVRMGATGFSR